MTVNRNPDRQGRDGTQSSVGCIIPLRYAKDITNLGRFGLHNDIGFVPEASRRAWVVGAGE
ncbi:MAG: hypothetical protein ACLP29_07445 [Dissulfurispiraceae bacterium]